VATDQPLKDNWYREQRHFSVQMYDSIKELMLELLRNYYISEKYHIFFTICEKVPSFCFWGNIMLQQASKTWK